MFVRQKNLVFIFIFIFFCLCLAGISIADEDKAFQPHEIEIYQINEGTRETIYNLMWYGKYKKILDLRLPPEALSKEFLEILKDYIKKGGTVWVYSCDLAGFFGFKPDYLEDKDFGKKKKKVKFGTEEKFPIALTVATPIKGSSILNQISKVEVQILELYPGKYSAVKLEKEEDFIPLLKVSQEEKLVAAIKKFGEGYVVFRPIVELKRYDNKVFEVNLREFSCHFSLPQEAQPDRIATIYLKNGLDIKCKILTKEINFETPESSEIIEFRKIKEVKLTAGGKFDEIIFENGKILKGFIYTSFIEIEEKGTRKILRKEYMEKIVFE